MLYKLLALTSFAMGISGQTKTLVDDIKDEIKDDISIVFPKPNEYAISVVLPNKKSLPKHAPCEVKGTIKLEITDTFDTRIFGKITGLNKNGVYGFHIHEYGDISSDKPGVIDCLSTGGHYNPFDRLHGGPDDRFRHVGDLGNIKADIHGVAKIDIIHNQYQISNLLNDKHNVIGRSFVIHENEDDLQPTSPTGNAGGRLACGVIGIAKPFVNDVEDSYEPEMICIGQYSNIGFEYISDSPSLGRERENSIISCRKWIIKEENKCGKDNHNCVSIEIINPNPMFENQYLGADIVGENGFLSDVITKSELWVMDLVNEVGLEKYVFYNKEKKMFLCAQQNMIETEYVLEFRKNGDSDECHWELKYD